MVYIKEFMIIHIFICIKNANFCAYFRTHAYIKTDTIMLNNLYMINV